MSRTTTKPFKYSLVAAEFMAEVFQIPEGGHKEWLCTLALDLVRAEGSTEYARRLIAEVAEFRKGKAEAGGAGGRAKARNEKDRAGSG